MINIQFLGKICGGFETIACVGDKVSFHERLHFLFMWSYVV